MRSLHFYTMRAIYAGMLAIILGFILLFTFRMIQDTRDYNLAKQAQEYNQATGFRAYE